MWMHCNNLTILFAFAIRIYKFLNFLILVCVCVLEDLSFYMKLGLKGYHGNRHSWLGETVVNGQCQIAALPKQPGKMTEIF